MLNKFIDFMAKANNCFSAVLGIEEELKRNGFKKLDENEEWDLNPGAYYVIRDDSSIIAFKMPNNVEDLKLKLVLSHTDSPTFKLKENYLVNDVLDVEQYGGAILSSFLDRPLSLAGRVFYSEDKKIKKAFYDLKKIIMIPNVAIHLRKDYNYNVAVDLRPYVGNDFDLDSLIAKELNIQKEAILGRDIFLYNKDRAHIAGVNDELILSPQIDNLECAYASLLSFIEASDDNSINLYGSFNNEEVGSLSTNGASSTFLKDIVERILKDYSLEEKKIILAKSFTISADNAHAIHPNHKELFDLNNAPILGGGIVIKENANLSYTSDAKSKAMLKKIFNDNNVKYQFYANKSDIRGGSTLGRLSLAQLSINSVDIGLAQHAMHSAMEVASIADFNELIKGLKAFYKTNFSKDSDEIVFK